MAVVSHKDTKKSVREGVFLDIWPLLIALTDYKKADNAVFMFLCALVG